MALSLQIDRPTVVAIARGRSTTTTNSKTEVKCSQDNSCSACASWESTMNPTGRVYKTRERERICSRNNNNQDCRLIAQTWIAACCSSSSTTTQELPESRGKIITTKLRMQICIHSASRPTPPIVSLESSSSSRQLLSARLLLVCSLTVDPINSSRIARQTKCCFVNRFGCDPVLLVETAPTSRWAPKVLLAGWRMLHHAGDD